MSPVLADGATLTVVIPPPRTDDKQAHGQTGGQWLRALPDPEPFTPLELPPAPDSPVGRTCAAPTDVTGRRATHPLRRLERRLGRDLLDLSTLTDAELAEIGVLWMTERVRRDARWTS